MEDAIAQTLRILLSNHKTQVRMGVIYGTQENITPNSEIKNCIEVPQAKMTLEKGTISK